MAKTTHPARSTRAIAGGEEPVAGMPSTVDCNTILQSVGEAAYEWRIGSDALMWSANAPAVLGLRNASPIASGRSFANLLDPANAKTRFDTVVNALEADPGTGVAY